MKLNYHHLYYFWQVARGESLTAVAAQLHVSQSALSMQIKQLEAALGEDLFRREGRRLRLTEAGHMALVYAEEIFTRGEELTALIQHRARGAFRKLRIGAVATLSRNFLEGFIRPLLPQRDLTLSLRSGSLAVLLDELAAHRLDLVLSNAAVSPDAERPWRCRLVARQQVSVIGHGGHVGGELRLPEDLKHYRLLLPGPQSDIRTAFELLCEQWAIEPDILAEVDDMAMLRLLARDSEALAILPSVVVKDEIARGELVELATLPQVWENFYAVSIRRQFENPVVQELMARQAADILAP